MGDFCAAGSHSRSVSFHCDRGGQTEGLLLTHLPLLLLMLLASTTSRKREPATSSCFFPILWNIVSMIRADVPGFQGFLPMLLYHTCWSLADGRKGSSFIYDPLPEIFGLGGTAPSGEKGIPHKAREEWLLSCQRQSPCWLK